MQLLRRPAQDSRPDPTDVDAGQGLDPDSDSASDKTASTQQAATPQQAGLLNYPGVTVDPDAHGPALRELSHLFSTGTAAGIH